MRKDADGYWMEGSDARKFSEERVRIPTKEKFAPPERLREFCRNSEHAPYVDLLWITLNDMEAKELLKVAAAYEEPPMNKLYDYLQNELADFKKEYAREEYEIIFNEMLVQIYKRYGIYPVTIIDVEEEYRFGAITKTFLFNNPDENPDEFEEEEDEEPLRILELKTDIETGKILPGWLVTEDEEIIRDSEYVLYYGFPKEEEINCKRYSDCEETKKRLKNLKKEIDKRKKRGENKEGEK
jgi:hypothetical protein